jgi:hypothetical protein
MEKFKKVHNLNQILADPRIERFIKDYDGYGKHMVECKTGWLFERERTIDIGSIKEICGCINDWLDKDER